MKIRKCSFIFIYAALCISIYAQEKKAVKFEMSIQNIMRDEKWIGNLPGSPYWSDDGNFLYFNWNPDNSKGDSLYMVPKSGGTPKKAPKSEQKNQQPRFMNMFGNISSGAASTRDKSKQLVESGGDIAVKDVKTGKQKTIIRTNDYETDAQFTQDEKKITFVRDNNLYWFNLESAELVQLTDFRKGVKSAVPQGRGMEQRGGQMPMPPQMQTAVNTPQAKFLAEQQMKLFDFLKKRRTSPQMRRRGGFMPPSMENVKKPLEVYLQEKTVSGQMLSPDERFVIFRLTQSPKDVKNTIVPNYVTASGYTEDIQARSKVGVEESAYELGIYDLKGDSVYYLQTKDIPGIYEYPKYLYEYPNKKPDESAPRTVTFMGPYFSEDGKYCVVTARSQDYKDKWHLKLDLESGKLTCLFRERNEAWIGGPGAYSFGWMPDNKRIWFQSELEGYSHLYMANVETGEVKQLTKGKYEVFNPQISKDKKYWYFTSSEVHPGERHFYKMPIEGGKAERITSMAGNNEIILSPDEKNIAILYSYSNKPAELYLMENKPGAEVKQITSSLSEEFKSYSWRDPEIITFKAGDGADVYARLYKPEDSKKNGAAVIFVHGAGYLQNAHKWWSEYYHEYMFHNLLADNGYTVLDIDYRGSAGYGRDWRTGIYRFMGGKDLSDNVEGAKYLVEKCGIDAERIGLYGGSYGGFITLMAMFTKPGVFAAGAALRSVTDWAHYNHGYTANILNVPYLDSLAYVRSSPIYYAGGLKGALLMCHGVVDDNVHFQDIVRLAQRLIELGKNNWELAIYPVESHSFTDPKSWTDEYKRIYKLFNDNLLKK